MSTINVTRKHNLSKEAMAEKLEALEKNPSSAHVTWKREGNKILLVGKSALVKGSTGEVVLGPNSIEITLVLSGMASFFKGMVEEKLNEQLDELLQ